MIKVNTLANKNAASLKALLEDAGLCFNDINEAVVKLFEVNLNDAPIGYFGYELYHTQALFRSMIVVQKYRNQGYGSLIWQEAKKRMQEEKVVDVYLLTNTAANFFTKQGFTIINRSSAPGIIAMTTEFIEFCPTNSVCMMIKLKPN